LPMKGWRQCSHPKSNWSQAAAQRGKSRAFSLSEDPTACIFRSWCPQV
jgi:hypothetical protein